MKTIRPLRRASWLSILFLVVALAACTAPSAGGSSAPDASAPAPAASDAPATAAPGGDDYEYGS